MQKKFKGFSKEKHLENLHDFYKKRAEYVEKVKQVKKDFQKTEAYKVYLSNLEKAGKDRKFMIIRICQTKKILKEVYGMTQVEIKNLESELLNIYKKD